jgi:putative ABC transport system permease protein
MSKWTYSIRRERRGAVRRTQWLKTFSQDVRITGRALLRHPGFALTAVMTLAIAIGANTAIFSLISATLLEPLPYPDADRIVQFWFTTPGGNSLTLSIPEVNAIASEKDIFADVASYDFGGPGVTITGKDSPEEVPAIHVAASYFRILGARVEAGRTFTADEDRPNGGRVAVLSDRLWRRHFGANSHILGREISLGGEPYAVTGVLAPNFRADPPAELWLPLQADPNGTGQASYIRAIGRLRPGIGIGQANARLKATFAAFLGRFPLFNPKAGFQVKALRETRAGDVRPTLMVLLFTVAFVLLIACSNVANLLLARAATRQHEMAVRAALGASRWRIVAQLLTESGLLAAAGGVLGLATGRLCLRLLLMLNPEAIPGGAFAAGTLDWRVLVFSGAVTIGATIFCGLLPALGATRFGLATALQGGGARTGTGRGTSRASSLLVIMEVALAVMLVAGAGLMIRTFAALRQVETGLDTHKILTLQMSLQGTRFQDTRAVASLVDSGVKRLESIPGVAAAASTWTLPVELAFGSSFIIEGRPLGNDRVHGPALMRPVSSNYNLVFGIALERGRFFSDRDTAASASVAVISEAMAKKFWPKGNAIGERITVDKYLGPDFAAPAREIIGIARDVRDTGLNQDPEPMIYIPQPQVPNGMTAIDVRVLPITWAVRTALPPCALSKEIDRALRAASGGLAVGRVRSMDDVVKESTARSDFDTVLLGAFAGIALLLAAVGLYGLISFSVGQRKRELAIRAALGATPDQLRGSVIQQSLSLTVIGILLGAGGSIGLASYMKSLLFGVKPVDPVTLSCACALLGLVAVLAAFIPARRAARLEPVEILRSA